MEGSRRVMSRHHSAVVQHAVHPPAGRIPKRHSASGITTGQQVQPPVCGVQPGRALELRTSLGIMRAKRFLRQQYAATEQSMESLSIQSSGSKLSNSKVRLKSARLQPLGIVEDDLITSQLCLGIVPARDTARRPKSSSTPGLPLDSPRTSYSTELSKTTDRSRQRSQSAILARAVDAQHLAKLLSVTRQTGFLPQDSPRETFTESTSSPDTFIPVPRKNQSKSLPPVVKYGELGMKIEVKGLKQSEESAHTPNSFESSSPKKNLPPITSSLRSPRQTAHIRAVHHAAQPANQLSRLKNTSIKIPLTQEPASETAITSTNDCESNRAAAVSPMHISIVTVAEGMRVEESTRTRQRKRTSSGRLSHGWSPPQAVQPLTGSAVYMSSPGTSRSPSRKSDREGEGHKEEASSQKCLNPNDSMLIQVNVNDFLEDS